VAPTNGTTLPLGSTTFSRPPGGSIDGSRLPQFGHILGLLINKVPSFLPTDLI
jgi:hypothetical protein